MKDKNHHKIAKNTAVLYVRLFIVSIIGLFIVKFVLSILGVDDYGLYAVVGGIVSIMNFLTTTMSATSYRYLAVELGKGEKGNINKIFNTVLIIHITISLIFVLLAEFIGVWYIENYLNIPHEKIPDALFVLHLSVVATFFGVINIPFIGLIIARERFVFSSSIDIIVSLLKLILVILLSYYLGNKLRAYSVIMAIITIVPPLIYFTYCKIKESDIVKWNFNKDKSSYKGILGFAWWAMFGAIAHIGQAQGAAVIINLFFGTALNAAFGISTQINTYVMMFVRNLNQATVPQIMKSQSAGDQNYSLKLVYKISKYTFLIMLIPSIPLIISMDWVLTLWLKKVPDFTSNFAILMLINGLINCLGSGFDALIQATGKIRNNQIGYSILNLAILPIAYIMYKLNYPPYTITVISIFASVAILFFQTYILTNLSNFKISNYLKETIYPSLFVVILIAPQFILSKLFGKSFFEEIFMAVLSMLLTITAIYFVGLNLQERNSVTKNFNKIINKLK